MPDLSRLEAKKHTAKDTIVDLRKLLVSRGDVHASEAEQSGLTFEQDLRAEPVFICGEAEEIVRAVDNLMKETKD